MKYIKTFESFGGHLSHLNDTPAIWYHGSKNEFDSFQTKKGTLNDANYTSPIFLTSSLEFAQSYAGHKDPIVYTTEITTNNIFDFRCIPTGYELALYLDNGTKKDTTHDYILGSKLYSDLENGVLNLMDDPDRAYSEIRSGNYGIMEQTEFYQWLKDHKHDGAYVIETGILNLFIFDPKYIKIINKKNL